MKRTHLIHLFLAVAMLTLMSLQDMSRVQAFSNSVLISEVQTGSVSSASEEFIELYNASSTSIDVSNWRLEYFSASAANFDSPSRKIPLHGIIGSHRYFLAASFNYLSDIANETFSAGLAKTGGHVRLVSQANDTGSAEVKDLVGWGNAVHPEGAVAPAPAEGKSLERNLGNTGVYLDSDNNSLDFHVNDLPHPQADTVLTSTPEEPAPSNPAPDPIVLGPQSGYPDTNPVSSNANDSSSPTVTINDSSDSQIPVVAGQNSAPVLPPRLSELLPNPAAPASDDTDEYVELFNPNNDSMSLAGYKLQTGNSFSYSYVFSSETLPGQSYVAFMVTQTGDVLANGGGKARLVDPDGNVIDTTIYETADAGQAWAFINASWQWTSVPTPNAANISSLVTGSTTGASINSKKLAAKPKTTKAAAATKKAAPKSKTSSSKPPKKVTSSAPKKEPPQVSSIHFGILAAITTLAVGYALYEYRDDLANRIQQLRRNRANRRAFGEER